MANATEFYTKYILIKISIFQQQNEIEFRVFVIDTDILKIRAAVRETVEWLL